MKTNTKDRIITYLKENNLASAHELKNYLGYSERAVFKQLKNLIDLDLISKMGKPPKVFYYLRNNIKNSFSIPFGSDWLLLEKEDYANYLFVTAAWEGFTEFAKSWGFVNGRYLSAEYINSSCNLFVLKSEYEQMNKQHFSMLFNKPQNWDKLHKLTFINSNKLFSWARSTQLLSGDKLSDKKLVKIIEVFNRLQQGVHCPRGPMWLLETPSNVVSDYLRSYLEEQSKEVKNIKTKPYLAFQILSASLAESIWGEEEKKLIEICKITDKKDRLAALEAHTTEYEWLEYGMEGQVLKIDSFKQRMDKILKYGVKKFVDKINVEKEKTAKNQKEVIKEYQIDTKHQKVFSIVRDSTAARLYSKDSQFFGYYALENILREFGKRTNLNLEQVRFLAPQDFKLALLSKKDFINITSQRMKHSLHFSDAGRTVFYYGSEAKKIRKRIIFNSEEGKIELGEVIKGQPAYRGKARGRVKIVNTINEIFKIHAGNILVSRMTNPSVVPAMKKAAAIVTDIGGITCHAAIVSRELRKPCVIGTKIATQVLRDGDLIEVDANTGIIRKL